MVYKTLKINKLESINGTTALNMYALSKGAKILRVHDVKQAMECIYLNEKINSNYFQCFRRFLWKGAGY